MAISQYGFRQLISQKQFLKVAARARQLSGAKLISIENKGSLMRLRCESYTQRGKGVYWTQFVQVDNVVAHTNLLVKLKGKKLRGDESELLRNDVQKLYKDVLDSGVKVTCDCPAYKFWGHEYRGTQLDYSLTTENRAPTRKNRMASGPTVCKHIHRVLLSYPLFSKTLEKYLVKQNIVKDKYPGLEAKVKPGSDLAMKQEKKLSEKSGPFKQESPFKSTLKGPTGPKVTSNIPEKKSPFKSSFR